MKINKLSFKKRWHSPVFVGAGWLMLARWHVGTAKSVAEVHFFSNFLFSHHKNSKQ